MKTEDAILLALITGLPAVSVILNNWLHRRMVDRMLRDIETMSLAKKARILASIENNRNKRPPV